MSALRVTSITQPASETCRLRTHSGSKNTMAAMEQVVDFFLVGCMAFAAAVGVQGSAEVPLAARSARAEDTHSAVTATALEPAIQALEEHVPVSSLQRSVALPIDPLPLNLGFPL